MPPPRKKEKKEQVDKKEELSLADPNSAVIRFEVDDVSSLDDDGKNSPEINVGGVNWRVNVCKDGYYVKELWIYLECMQDQKPPWSIDVKSEYILLNVDKRKNLTETKLDKFDNDHQMKFQTDWDDVIDEEMGFINKNKITVEVRFSISNMKGVRIAERFDFTNSTESFHDIALVIGGEKVYANKVILAAHSPVFNAMFNGYFKEKNESEIELKDLNREEFIEMLHVIYPSRKKITDDSVEYLVKLADRFQIKFLLEDAEDFLIESSEYFNLENLRIADQYRLNGLLDICLSKIESKQQLDEIKASSIYKKLSIETTRAILEKALEILE